MACENKVRQFNSRRRIAELMSNSKSAAAAKSICNSAEQHLELIGSPDTTGFRFAIGEFRCVWFDNYDSYLRVYRKSLLRVFGLWTNWIRSDLLLEMKWGHWNGKDGPNHFGTLPTGDIGWLQPFANGYKAYIDALARKHEAMTVRYRAQIGKAVGGD